MARSPAGVNGATLQENARWLGICGHQEAFPSVVNSLESLGFLSVFKACHQIVSVPEDNNDREVRISFSK